MAGCSGILLPMRGLSLRSLGAVGVPGRGGPHCSAAAPPAGGPAQGFKKEGRLSGIAHALLGNSLKIKGLARNWLIRSG
jgi:hypothetical protein